MLDAHAGEPGRRPPGPHRAASGRGAAPGRVLALARGHRARLELPDLQHRATRARCSSGSAASTRRTGSRRPRTRTSAGARARPARPTEFVDGARAWHAVHRVGVVGLVRRMRIKADVARLTRRHPGVRHHYYRGIFWKRSHAFLPLAAAGRRARAPRTRGASLLLALPVRAPLPRPARLVRGHGRVAAGPRGGGRRRDRRGRGRARRGSGRRFSENRLGRGAGIRRRSGCSTWDTPAASASTARELELARRGGPASVDRR